MKTKHSWFRQLFTPTKALPVTGVNEGVSIVLPLKLLYDMMASSARCFIYDQMPLPFWGGLGPIYQYWYFQFNYPQWPINVIYYFFLSFISGSPFFPPSFRKSNIIRKKILHSAFIYLLFAETLLLKIMSPSASPY